MQVRLARLEGEVSSLKTLATAMIAIMLGGFAFLGVQATRLDNRTEAIAGDVQKLAGEVQKLAGEVQGVPGKVNGDLLALTRTLADAISAAKQTPAQVLLVPTPLPPSAPSPR